MDKDTETKEKKYFQRLRRIQGDRGRDIKEKTEIEREKKTRKTETVRNRCGERKRQGQELGGRDIERQIEREKQIWKVKETTQKQKREKQRE